MKRWLSIGVITAYLGAMVFGVAAHALNFKQTMHPAMYFIVWDMFCGWSCYENRLHIIGEGESGRFYRLAPGPWGEFVPFGAISREHYDPFVNHAVTIATSTLRHTEHEPIERIYVVEENWAKKFNLSDEAWAARYDEPKDPKNYYHLRQVFNGEGKPMGTNPSWFDYQLQLCLSDNPRIWRDAHHGKPFYQVNPMLRSTEPVGPIGGLGVELSQVER